MSVKDSVFLFRFVMPCLVLLLLINFKKLQLCFFRDFLFSLFYDMYYEILD